MCVVSKSSGIVPFPERTPEFSPSIKKTFSVKRGLKKTDTTLSAASTGSYIVTSCAYAVDECRTLSSSANKGVELTRTFGIILTPFYVYYAAKDIQKIVFEAGVKEKIRSCFLLLTRIDSVVDSIYGICSILDAFELVGKRAVKWLSIYWMVSFFVGFSSVAVAVVDVWDSGTLTYKLKRILKKLENETLNDYEKAHILGDLLKEMEQGGLRNLRKKLMISKKAQFRGEHFERVISRLSGDLFLHGPFKDEAQKQEFIQSKQGQIAEATELLRKLAPRVKLELGLGSIDLVNTVVNTAGEGLVAFAQHTPAAVAGYVIVATSRTISLLFMGGKFLFVNKNPFDPDSKNNARLLVTKIVGKVSHLRARLYTLVLARNIFSLRN